MFSNSIILQSLKHALCVCACAAVVWFDLALFTVCHCISLTITSNDCVSAFSTAVKRFKWIILKTAVNPCSSSRYLFLFLYSERKPIFAVDMPRFFSSYIYFNTNIHLLQEIVKFVRYFLFGINSVGNSTGFGGLIRLNEYLRREMHVQDCVRKRIRTYQKHFWCHWRKILLWKSDKNFDSNT